MAKIELKYRDTTNDVFSVAEAWQRLEAWLANSMPSILADLDPPAEIEEIEALEEKIGQRLPDDVRESFLIHNGQGYATGAVFGLRLLPLEAVAGDWDCWNTAIEQGDDLTNPSGRSFPAGLVRRQYFNAGWIPLTYDGGGNHIAVDLNPDEQGIRGQVIIFGPDEESVSPVLARSWGQFLTDIADELEQGNVRSLDDPDNPIFKPHAPRVEHFHRAGVEWARHKLGLRKLAAVDQPQWEEWRHKEAD